MILCLPDKFPITRKFNEGMRAIRSQILKLFCIKYFLLVHNKTNKTESYFLSRYVDHLHTLVHLKFSTILKSPLKG